MVDDTIMYEADEIRPVIAIDWKRQLQNPLFPSPQAPGTVCGCFSNPSHGLPDAQLLPNAYCYDFQRLAVPSCSDRVWDWETPNHHFLEYAV